MRPDNLLVVDASNYGKTAIARRFPARPAVPEDTEAERSRIPVALIQVPNDPRIPTLLSTMIAALGRESSGRRPTARLRAEAYKAASDVGLHLLLVDDLHDVRASGAASVLV